MVEELCCQDVVRDVTLSATEAVMKWLISPDYPASSPVLVLLSGRNAVLLQDPQMGNEEMISAPQSLQDKKELPLVI